MRRQATIRAAIALTAAGIQMLGPAPASATASAPATAPASALDLAADSSTGTITVVSDPGDRWVQGTESGAAVATYGHVGCASLDADGQCTSGVWPHVPGATWIWRPGRDAGPVTFVDRFRVPPRPCPVHAVLQVTADNAFRVWLNGRPVAAVGSFQPSPYDQPLLWATVYEYPVTVAVGRQNVLAVRALNWDGRTTYSNPAGVVYRLRITYGCSG